MSGFIVKCILYAAIAAAGLRFLIVLFKNRNSVSVIGIKDAVKSFIGLRMLGIAVLSIGFFAAFSYMKYVYNTSYPSLYISLNYEEAAKGLNPNGTRFNASEIISDDIVAEAAKRAGIDLSVSELKSCLQLKTNFDEASVDTGNSDLSGLSIATDYRLVFKPDMKTMDVDGMALLSQIGDVYYEKFMSEKTENTDILNIDLTGYKQDDYHAVSDYLGTKAALLKQYIDIYNHKNSTFRTAEGGSFGALSEKIKNYKDVELERFNSFVVENGLSENPAKFSRDLDYRNKLMKLDYDKNMAAYNVRLEAINLYDSQMATIVLVPTRDRNLEYYMSRTKIGVDNYADEAQAHLDTAVKLKNNIDSNSYAKLKVNEALSPAETYAKADGFVSTLIDELNGLAEESRNMVSAYIREKRNPYIQTGFYTKSVTNRMDVKKGIIAAALFAFLLSGSSLCGIIYRRRSE